MKIMPALLLLLPPLTASAIDIKAGEALHDKQCTACHIRLVGGDGNGIYTRKDSVIHSLTDLRDRVAMCTSQTNGALTLPQEAEVVAYLNQRFYHFGPAK